MMVADNGLYLLMTRVLRSWSERGKDRKIEERGKGREREKGTNVNQKIMGSTPTFHSGIY